MSKAFLHKLTKKTPPRLSPLPINEKLVQAYGKWQEFLPHFPKTSRYTLAARIDNLFVDNLELLVASAYLAGPEKINQLEVAAKKLDLLKFLTQIAWRLKALDNKKYLYISQDLDEVGRMLGGWLRGLKTNFPPEREE